MLRLSQGPAALTLLLSPQAIPAQKPRHTTVGRVGEMKAQMMMMMNLTLDPQLLEVDDD